MARTVKKKDEVESGSEQTEESPNNIAKSVVTEAQEPLKSEIKGNIYPSESQTVLDTKNSGFRVVQEFVMKRYAGAGLRTLHDRVIVHDGKRTNIVKLENVEEVVVIVKARPSKERIEKAIKQAVADKMVKEAPKDKKIEEAPKTK